MNSSTLKRLVTFTGMLGFLVTVAHAYPPAPYHVFYGTVRNDYGDPIDASDAKVLFISTNGTSAQTPIAATTEAGVNYRLTVPMDSARSLKVEPTWDGRHRQNQPFQLKAQIGSDIFLPLEMIVSRPLGQPAGTTRLDLTLGVDTDGDGLPDAWEIANGLNPNDPNDANGDADGDGISNRDEYMAGTFPFDASDGFRLVLVAKTNTHSTLEFFAIRGRSYTVQASANLLQWTPVSFRVSGDGTLQNFYPANNFQTLRIEVPAQAGETNCYFRGLVQ